MSAKKKAAYQKGLKAEALAAAYLRLKGYKVLKQRYKTGVGEIDLIAGKDDFLIFVEVKSYKQEEAALYAVSEKSRRRIEAAALHFISEHPEFNDHGMRFDVVIVPHSAFKILGGRTIRHIDNAWFSGE